MCTSSIVPLKSEFNSEKMFCCALKNIFETLTFVRFFNCHRFYTFGYRNLNTRYINFFTYPHRSNSFFAVGKSIFPGSRSFYSIVWWSSSGSCKILSKMSKLYKVIIYNLPQLTFTCLKFSYRNSRKRCEICSKLTTETPESLNIFHSFFYYFYWWLWTSKS